MYLLFYDCLVSNYLSYNSVIFSTTAVSEYIVVLAAQPFLHNGSFSLATTSPIQDMGASELSNFTSGLQDLQARAVSGGLERLNNSECITQYSAIFNTHYSNLVLVTNYLQSNNSVLECYDVGPSGDGNFNTNPAHRGPPWICQGDLNAECPYTSLIDNAESWNFSSLTFDNGRYYDGGNIANFSHVVVDYCLAQSFQSNSQIELHQGT